MDEEGLLSLVKKGEDSKLQFKEKISSPDSLAAEICAFSNSDGGIILIGVSDDGKVTGLTFDEVTHLNQMVSNVCSQKIDPTVSVTTENIQIDERIVVAIHVPLGGNKFYMANGRDIWVKLGADKRRARREEIQRLLQESGHYYADEMIIEGTSLSDIRMERFEYFFEERTGDKLSTLEESVEHILSNLKLMENGSCTLAGLLLFGKNPEEKRPNITVKAVSYFGNDSSAEDYRDSKDIGGSLGILYESSFTYIENHLMRLQKDQNFNSTGILEVPEVALQEAIVNALIHRNYLIASHIRLFVFKNRVEIISPGSLPNTASVETIKWGIHIERNPIVASFIKDIEEVPYRGIGTGIGRILRSCKEAGVRVEFIDEKEMEQFKVVFYRDEI